MSQPKPRIEVVDALRGFAILSIMLLHNIEHFDFYYFPENLPPLIKSIDKGIWDTLFFLFAGKSYAIFALLFGFTFFIQLNNRAAEGKDFRLRFLWRLFLLLAFGIINTLFYQGDILSLYAVIGVSLVVVAKLNSKIVFFIAAILLLQPYDWYTAIQSLQPGHTPKGNVSYEYFAKTGYMADGSFSEVMWGNITIGKKAVLYWYHENGRYFQTAALFMIGMLIGRKRLFEPSAQHLSFWRKMVLNSIIGFALLFALKTQLGELISVKATADIVANIITTWSNVAFMFLLVSLFIVLFSTTYTKRLLKKLAPLGKMSMSNYIMQSIAGTFIYYGWGLGLYRYTGATYALLIGIGLFLLQLWFCKWWLKHHRQGPLETLWHKATWIAIKSEQKTTPMPRTT